MKKEKTEQKPNNIFKAAIQKLKNFYQTKKKLAFGVTAVGLALIVLLGVFIFSSNSGKSNSTTYSTVKIIRGNILQTVDAVGNLEAVPSAVLNWKASGVVGSVNVKIGDRVKEGDVLATLVDSSVDSSILTAQNDLLSAKLSLETLRAGNSQFQTATQTLATAKRAYAKELANREWWIITGVSDAAIDAARAKYYETQLDFWIAQQEYEKLATAVKQADLTSTKTSVTPTSTPSVDSASQSNVQIAKPESADKSQTSSDPIDTSNAETQKNASASPSTNDLVAERDKAYKKMKAAEEIFNKASRNLNYLIGNGYGNNNVVEQEFLQFDVAKAALAEAEATWQAYKDSSPYIKAAEAKVQALQNTVNSSKIIAPFDGTITDLLVSEGQTVSSGEEALQVDNVDNLKITFSVSEVDVNKLDIGQEAEITFAAVSGKTYKGVVEQVGQAGTNSSGVVEFYATIKVLDADENIKPGFSANISIITDKVEDVLLVPNSALMTDETTGKTFVLTSLNGKITPVEVEAGLKDDTYTEVKNSTFKEGDIILVAVKTSGSDSANNRAMFGIMNGGFGGGEPPRMQPSTGSNSNSSGRN